MPPVQHLPEQISLQGIIEECAKAFNCEISEIQSKTRGKDIFMARVATAYFAATLLNTPSTTISNFTGGHSRQAVRSWIRSFRRARHDQIMRQKHAELLTRIQSRFHVIIDYTDWKSDPVLHNTASPRIKTAVFTRSQITVLSIIEECAAEYFVTPDDVLAHVRVSQSLAPRQIAAFISRHLLKKSFPWLARALGGFDHTTILTGIRSLEKQLVKDDVIRRHYFTILDRLSAKHGITVIADPVTLRPVPVEQNGAKAGKAAIAV